MLISITPPIDEDYWVFRIKLYKDQSLIAFPKFWTIGIGFSKEEDWNSNLPYTFDSEKIYNHIKKNKCYKEISKSKCIKALEILKKACVYYKEHELESKQFTVETNKETVMNYISKLYEKVS